MSDVDLLTLGEALDAINSNPAGSSVNHDEVARWVTGVSRRIDSLCGPVVQRTVSNELHDGGGRFVRLDLDHASAVTSIVEYLSTSATTLTVETNASKPSAGYMLDVVGGVSFVRRRSGGSDCLFPAGRRNVDVSYTAGRYAATADVDGLFKVAAGSILRRLWKREQGSWAMGGDPFGAPGSSPGFFKAVDPTIREMLGDEMRGPVVF